MEETQQKTRLQILQEQLDQEQQRQAQLKKAAADKAAAEAAEARRQAEARERAENEVRQLRIDEAKRKAQEIAAQKAEAIRLEQVRITELERQAEIQREKIREDERQQAAEKALQERLFAIEQDNARIERELQQKSQPKAEEPKPVTLQSPENPLSRIFNPNAEAVTQSQSLSSEENTKIQALKDRVAIAVLPVRKSPRYANTSVSSDLEKVFKPIFGQVNPTRCDEMSATWEEIPLLKTAREVAEQCKARQMSHDGAFALLETLLEGQANGAA